MKKLATKSLALFVMILGIIIFTGSFSSVHAQGKTFTLKLTNFLPVQHVISLALDEWGKELEKATNGRVKVKCYHSATLASAVQQYDAVTRGIADVGNHVMGYTVNRFPLSEVLDLPIGIPSGVVASRMMIEFYNKFKPKELDDVKVLWLHGQGPGYVCLRNKPVQSLKDLAKLKLRTYGGNAKFVQALGAAPVAMPMTDVYDALSRGMVDGLLSGFEGLEGWRTGEHVKYVTENKWTAYTAAMIVVMNKKVWNTIPKDLQNIIDKVSSGQPEKFGKAWDAGETSAKAFVDKRGVKLLTLDRAEEQRWVDKGAKPVFEDYVKRMKEQHLPGEESLKFVVNYLSHYKK
jgi:TRAP-type C4-dicarboxylate transport system substrate-binding protein